MSEEPRERVIEVALQELLRAGQRPDYAVRVRQRWEAQRQENLRQENQRQGTLRHATQRPVTQRERRSGRGRTALGPRAAHGDAPAPRTARPLGAGRLAAAAAILAVGAALAWRALPGGTPAAVPGTGPTSPTTGLAAAPARDLAPGLEALPAAFGEVIVNTTDATLALTLAHGERIELGPLAVLALEAAPETELKGARPLPRLLDGEAVFQAPDDPAQGPRAELRYGVGNSPAALVLAPGGRFRAELARASGPHPLDVEGGASDRAAPARATRTFGRGQLLGPTWLTLEPLVGQLMWRDADGQPRDVAKLLEGTVVDAEGTLRPFSREQHGLLNKLVGAVAPMPGVEPLRGQRPSGTWEVESLERELVALLEAEPAYWIPAVRKLERRLASHADAYSWRSAHAIVAGASSDPALRVARRWWRDAAQRFDTDALLALAEAGHEPFVRELAALLEGDLRPLDDAEARQLLRRGGPDADVDLLVLTALARGDVRRTGRALDLTLPLAVAARKGDLDGAAARSLLAAATLARAGLADPWDAASAALFAHVRALAEEDDGMLAALLAAHLDVAAESLGLAPYAAEDPAQLTPRLAYYEARVRARTLVLRGELAPVAGRPATLDAWLETWRGR